VLTELARIAYFGSIVPNTAIAKEASSSNWAQGWSYLGDFVSSYALVLPILLLLAWWFIAARRSEADGARRYRMVALLVVAGGVLHAAYIVRVGGDFMHARMLLPTTFVLLLPVSVVAVRGRYWWLVAAVVGWVLVCGLWLRPTYSAALLPGVSSATASDPFDARTGIADERLFWVRSAGTAHPVTLDDYLPNNGSARAGARVARWADAGRRGLLLDPSAHARSLVPLRPGVGARIVVSAPALGLFGYAAGDQVKVVDNHGLASPLAAHQQVDARGRPGHEKDLQDAWVLAEFADRRAALPAGIARSEVVAAQRALSCDPLRSLIDQSTRTLTVRTALDNVDQAMTSFSYRFAPDPIAAARQACGTRHP
jgi:arabinofuranosyltransferase